MNESRRGPALLFIPIFLTVVSCSLLTVFGFARTGTLTATRDTSARDEQEQAVAGPNAVVSPTALDFGLVLVGQTSPQKKVRLTNTGDADLTISSISISGPFALPVNHCGRGVKVGTHCDVYVTFTPEALETETGILTFTDDASNSPQTVSLTGTGATTVPTQTTIVESTRNINVGQFVTLTAAITSLGGGVIPDGEQVFFGDTQTGGIGVGITQGGSATIQTSGPFRHGQNDLYAAYSGDSQFFPSKSRLIKLYVHPWPSTTTLSSSPNPSSVGQDVTLTASVVTSGPVPPTGFVSFFAVDGADFLKHRFVKLSPNGTASVVFAFPSAGNWFIQAHYGGDFNTGGSHATGTQQVNP